MPDRTESCLAEYDESFVRGELAMRKLCARNLQKKIAGRYESYESRKEGIARRRAKMLIGEPLRTLLVEPLELPVKPRGEPEPVPILVPEPELEQVPVAQ